MPTQRRLPKNVDLDFTLRRMFGKTGFRPLQREVITTALNGHDVFLQAATSFGKSLCYQLPAVIDHGITIVISPLLALMTNQVEHLKRYGIQVASLNSTTPYAEKVKIKADLQCGHPHTRLLYVTPETMTSNYFRNILQKIHEQRELARIAIDEAHCISEWGHDFRPSFTALKFLREPDSPFHDVPMMLLTATATENVRDDVINTLGLDPHRLKCFNTTAARPNLHFEIRYKSDDLDHYTDFVAWYGRVKARKHARLQRTATTDKATTKPDESVCGIIYVATRAQTEDLATRLRAESPAIGAMPYHAGLSKEARNSTLAAWVAGTPGYAVVVATTAFGMGIDKDNVRFVAHWTTPKSFEGYYQEAGRCGRDGRAGLCLLYYAREDRDRVVGLMSREFYSAVRRAEISGDERKLEAIRQQMHARAVSFQALVSYCENMGCRHKEICEYFGNRDMAECNYACDFCKDPTATRKAKEKGLATEEWCSTQRQTGAYEVDEYDYDI